ncbi:MAG: 3-phosphoshikimate 1-carboxyvinyltransferase [Armatimonadetes bacterium]|nr:3-phosphoshikimate 1-carboxyvinyltransferase [Armatimonadota bacterium]
MGTLTVGRTERFWGEIRPPSDKSLTHRAYLLSGIAEQGGLVRDPLKSQDCEDTLQILRDLGVPVEADGAAVRIRPCEWKAGSAPLWCGNSGTTMRLAVGVLAGVGVEAELAGDESLSRRPMRRIVEPLRRMGADIEGDTPPVRIRPAPLRGIEYRSPVASAQVKSAVLLAGLFAEGRTTVIEPAQSRDHTERMLAAAGCAVSCDGTAASVDPGRPKRIEMAVPGDISSAAFFLVAGALVGGPVHVRQVGLNPTRTGIVEVLRSVGAQLHVGRLPDEQGEPVADLVIEAPTGPLKPFHIEGALVPRLIDEVPVLAVLATQCEGTTTIRDAGELRLKESDRIERTAEGLRAMGARVETFEDGMAITGPTPLHGARIIAANDHRIAMAFAVAGLVAEGETVIEGADAIRTSFPGFEGELRRLSHV